MHLMSKMKFEWITDKAYIQKNLLTQQSENIFNWIISFLTITVQFF